MRAYWSGGADTRNFGDALTPILLREFAGIEATWAPPQDAEIVVCGSILGDLPDNYSGIVLGAGAMWESVPLPEHADVRVLRGPLSGRAPGYGDPGLLAALVRGARGVVQTMERRTLGVIPHYIDDVLARLHPDAHIIDITASPREVISAAASCDRIISSSLHGLVLADSLGKPRCWSPCSDVLGAGFKFEDYHAVFEDGPILPSVFYLAPADHVRHIQSNLLAEFRRLRA